MKRILSLPLALLLCFGATTGIAITATAANDVEAAQVYLVPGFYTDWRGDKQVHANVVENAEKLSADEAKALNMEGDVYKAGEAGETLPVATTTQTDRNGELFTFNGWWTIVDAEVTYFTEVPEVKETTYLYADFRAALSQHLDPIIPQEGEEEALDNYLLITHTATGRQEKVPLFVSGTEIKQAVAGSYGGPVQFYNEWFEMEPGDTFQVFVSGIYGQVPTLSPASGRESLQGVATNEIAARNATLAQIDEDQHIIKLNEKTTGNLWRIYIKFYDAGGHMDVYFSRPRGVN